jgi:RHS repeat-associated protein
LYRLINAGIMKKQTLTPATNRFFAAIKACTLTLLIILGHFKSFSQSVNQNYVVSTIPRIKGLIDDAALKTAITDKVKVQISIDYADGLGRSLQSVQWRASPLGNDIVLPKVYDSFGREEKKYLPYAPTGTAGNYRSDAITSAQASFYNAPTTGVVQIPTATQVAYAETKFEASPLNRPVEQGAPGLSWKIGGGHTVTQSYLVNTATDAIKLWVVSTATTGASQSSTYPAGSLTVIKTTDEDGNAVILFKDIENRVISRKVQSGPGTYVVTDYIYDDLGNLRYVIPPASSASGPNTAVTIPSSFTESSTVFLNYFYGYHYDDLGRSIEKKIPGQGWQYVVYNSKDQPIMTQDANQKNLGIWMVSKYDALGRVVMTGKLTSASTRSSLQSSADGSITATFESFTNVSTNYGYTHVSYPDLTGSGGKVLTVSYYDKYDVLSNTMINPSTSVFAAPSTSIDTLEQNPRGLATAKLINVLGTNSYLFSMVIYDKDENIVSTISQHYQGGSLSNTKYDAVESQYSFQKIATRSTRRHYLTSASTPAVTIISTPSYDHMNRSLLLKQQYSTPTVTGTTVNINKNDYNELGQLITKHLHSTATGMPTNSGFLQHVDYRYNSRGWLARINNSASNLDETYTTQLDLFGENIDYDQVTNGIGGTAKYNGNISNIKWQAKWSSNVPLPQQYKGYVFTYDAMNRLTNADYKAQSSADNTAYNEAITYDESGNILTLTRKNGASSTLNSLVYNYMNGANRSHMLMSVSDATGTEAYNSNYTYDTNGNLLTDSKKTIATPISYNELNLPAQVNINIGTKVLKYTYDATGRRLERLTTLAGATVEDRFYTDGIEYVGDVIELIHTSEGRATPNGAGGAYIFEYSIADHLGNVRAVFGDKNNDGVLTADEILQTTDYYAFGRQITYSQALTPNPDNTYLYNGKELQKDLGEYDFGARYYDPIIARWNLVDPMAETSRRWSTYTYALNNPFRFIDPDGMDTGPTYTDGYGTYSYANATYSVGLVILDPESPRNGTNNGNNNDNANRNRSSNTPSQNNTPKLGDNDRAGIDGKDDITQARLSGSQLDDNSNQKSDPFAYAGNLFHLPGSTLPVADPANKQLGNTCEFCSVAAAMGYFGKKIDGLDLLAKFKVNGKVINDFQMAGILNKGLTTTLESSFFNQFLLGNYDKNIMSALSKGYPVLASYNVRPHMGHEVLITGISYFINGPNAGFNYAFYNPATGVYGYRPPSAFNNDSFSVKGVR